jgi:hypothetical protein
MPEENPERLTEQLQRQDLQDRVNNLSEMLEVVSREQKEAQEDPVQAKLRWDLLDPEDNLHSIKPQGIVQKPDGSLMLPGAIPQVLRLSPEEQEEYYEDCRAYLKTLELKNEKQVE